MNEKLEKILIQLESLYPPISGKPRVEYQTSPDESVVIGTEAEIVSLATSLIRSIIESKEEEFTGVKLKSSNCIAGALDPMGVVALDWVLINHFLLQLIQA